MIYNESSHPRNTKGQYAPKGSSPAGASVTAGALQHVSDKTVITDEAGKVLDTSKLSKKTLDNIGSRYGGPSGGPGKIKVRAPVVPHTVHVSFKHPAYNERDGFSYEVYGRTKADAIKSARRRARDDGHTGVLRFKATRSE